MKNKQIRQSVQQTQGKYNLDWKDRYHGGKSKSVKHSFSLLNFNKWKRTWNEWIIFVHLSQFPGAERQRGFHSSEETCMKFPNDTWDCWRLTPVLADDVITKHNEYPRIWMWAYRSEEKQEMIINPYTYSNLSVGWISLSAGDVCIVLHSSPCLLSPVSVGCLNLTV